MMKMLKVNNMSEDKAGNLMPEIFHEIDILNNNNKIISKYANNFDLKNDKKSQNLILIFQAILDNGLLQIYYNEIIYFKVSKKY